MLSDKNAESLSLVEESPLRTYGSRKVLLYLDTIAAQFNAGDRVDINILKARAIIPHDTLRLKVVARGSLSKALMVYANDFDLCAVKMLLLTGGKAIRQKTKSVSQISADAQ